MQSIPDRRLAAIVFTDIVGFTALSAEDEEKALSLLDQQRDLLKPIVEQFNGKWLKEMGDGLLLSFISTKQAVNCSIEIQKATKSIEGLNLRIGIHQGDILEKGGDVFGDDVNIASRIEPFAAVGGVAISDKVNRDISGSPEITTKFVGIPRLKGVSQEVKIYCIISHGLPETDITKITAKLEKDVKRLWFNQKFIFGALFLLFIIVGSLFVLLPFEKKVPSIGILYMENRGLEEDEFWAQGITEDVIIEVASAGLIRVATMHEILEFKNTDLSYEAIADKLRVRYVLASSFHNREGLLTMRSQLLDTDDGSTVYAEKVEEPIDKSSTLTDRIATNILKSLKVETKSNISKTRSINPEAYEYYLKGKHKHNIRQNMEDTEVARGLLLKATELDSNLVEAYLVLGTSYLETGDYNKATAIYEESLERSQVLGDHISEAHALSQIGEIKISRGELDIALGLQQKALRLSEQDNNIKGILRALNLIGLIYFRKNEPDSSISAFNRMVELNKEMDDKIETAKILNNLGVVYKTQGNYDQALENIIESNELLKNYGERLKYAISLANIGRIYVEMGNYEKAIEYENRSLEISQEIGYNKGIGNIYFGRVFTMLRMNKYDEMLQYVEKALKIYTELSLPFYIAGVLDLKGQYFYIIGDYKLALESFRSANITWIEQSNLKNRIHTLSWIALIEAKLQNIDTSLIIIQEIETLLVTTEPTFDDEIVVRWNCSKTWKILGDQEKAQDYLKLSYDELMTRADKYTDSRARNALLNDIIWNREIVATKNSISQ